ncbi:hypothetical protein [Endozoicomonas sp. 8E]|uniref:hypothetical protein n=1 Tax=Endozoicomonas sp. 8E TaxID=3035692 RepID=UPI0029394551|nr:hypothetical protein [Endozoicomonas sp. 8E]WOG30029.1 hypothetical protein P6910_10355 [Endozoicomonas sp. 8E]
MRKIDDSLAVCRMLFFCLMMQLATIPQTMAVGSLAEPIALSSLLPLLATVYRSIPEAKNLLPELNPPPLPAQDDESPSFPFDATVSAVPEKNPLVRLLPAPFSLPIRHAEPDIPVLFQDSIWLRLNQEESLVLVPSEFPAVAKVSDMDNENWPQLITAESVYRSTAGVGSVFRWANQRLLNSLYDDPLLRFLAFIHGAAFYVQDTSGQLSYIIQHNGKLLSISRFEAHLRFSLYSQSFLESLYPEIFGPSLPAGGGWHQWNRFIRKQPFHPPEKDTNNRSGARRPVNPEGRNNRRNDRSTRSENHAMRHSGRSSEQTPEPGRAPTERNGRQEQINQQSLSCPTCSELITGGSSGLKHRCPTAFTKNQKVAKKRRLQALDEHSEPTIPKKRRATASRSHRQDKHPRQNSTSLRPYRGSSKRTFDVYMNNNPQRNYCATYANVPGRVKPKTVRIGNQSLMTLDTSQSFVDPAMEAKRNTIEFYNFSFLVDFLRKNSDIKYIVDIGCGDGEISLLMQNYLNELKFRVKVIPVDVSNVYARANGTFYDKTLPINIIRAQEIAGASPATTLFTAIHPYTGVREEAIKLTRKIAQGKTCYYITTLIINNPGCFVLATEDPHASSPQLYIPPELVYTKHYWAYANCFWPWDIETKPGRQAKAAEMNAESGVIHRLNQLLAKLPEQRDRYLDSISNIADRCYRHILTEPEEFWPDNIFRLHVNGMLCKENVALFESIKHHVATNKLELRCWHVYRQDISASEVTSETAKEPYSSN